MLINATCQSGFSSYSDYNPANNFSYTKWSGGEVDVTTGIEAPNGLPAQLWWNPVYKTTNHSSSTNLSLLNIKENTVKTSTKEKRLKSLVPGVPSIQANTFVHNGMLKFKFFQPSVLDETTVYFTAYKEPAFLEHNVSDDTDVIAARRSSKVATPSNFIDTFFFNITDTNDPTNPGDNRAGRRATDGKYYTVVFPDDFVGTKFTATDPFRSHRDKAGRIDEPLMITLNIPSGVILSGNSFHNHIQATDLSPRNQFLQQGTKYFGPPDSAGRRTTEIFAANDPCIKLNLHTGEITDQALAQMLIRIENNGTMVGAGGWGSYGQMNIADNKDDDEYPGGGGGGGAGHHPVLATENPRLDWVGEHTAPPTTITQPINTDAEIASAQAASAGFWNGPNNYVEWGIGGNIGTGLANTYYTGMDYITWKSIGPGKPGTGYLGATDSYIPLQPPLGRPYSVSQWSENQFGSVLTENQYARLPGTYVFSALNIPRFKKEGWGNPGTAGTSTSGGAGGAEVSVKTFGWNQHPDYRIAYDNPSNPGYNAGVPSSGSGGSCVYLFANTTKSVTGTQVQLINNGGGIIKSGGGGGSGGSNAPGLGGGNLGRPGKYTDDVFILEDEIADSGQSAWNNYSRRGEPGKLVWWNATNVPNNYTIVNYSTNATHGSIEGMDYNASIGGDDYVSYLPDVQVNPVMDDGTLGKPYYLGGTEVWSRKRNSLKQTVYTDLKENTYEEFVNENPKLTFGED